MEISIQVNQENKMGSTRDPRTGRDQDQGKSQYLGHDWSKTAKNSKIFSRYVTYRTWVHREIGRRVTLQSNYPAGTANTVSTVLLIKISPYMFNLQNDIFLGCIGYDCYCDGHVYCFGCLHLFYFCWTKESIQIIYFPFLTVMLD